MTAKLFRAATLFSPADEGRAPRGDAQGKILTVPNAAILCKDGAITRVGAEAAVLDGLDPKHVDWEIDLGGAPVIPGFVDPHTHMCFAARREKEFELRLAGTSYMEILEQGGGILSSVRAVRGASEDDLYRVTLENANRALLSGTTTVEIKSGYGLDLQSEEKMLRVIARVKRSTPLDVVPTFMGAHAVPEEYRADPDAYVELIVREMLPAVKKQGIAKFCDIFCEDGVFSSAQSRRIMQAARDLGFGIKIHADEIIDLGGASLAGQMRAASAEHLLAAGDEGLEAMASGGTVAVLLPATAYSLKKNYARARRMIELGVPVALATDCNPGSCFCESMPFVFGLAVMEMNMTVAEALVASTLAAAYAIGMQGRVGSLTPGKSADFLVLDGDSPAVLAYHAGANPVTQVYKRGELI